MRTLPQLSDFTPHCTVPDIDLEGHRVPGLTGMFYRRPADGRTASVGLYRYRDAEIFMAWGYVGEEHCRWTAYRCSDGRWTPPQEGCPRVRVVRGGLLLHLGDEPLTLPVAAPVPAPVPAQESGCAGKPPPVARDLPHTTDSGSVLLTMPVQPAVR